MGFNTKDIYRGGNGLKAVDLQKKKWRVTIKDVQLAQFDENGKTKRMLDLSFNETDKTLMLNRTNCTSIEYLYGPDTDAWLGKQIVLYPTMVAFQGNQVEAIRVDTAAGMQESAPQSPPPQSQVPPEAYDDDIPFR